MVGARAEGALARVVAKSEGEREKEAIVVLVVKEGS
jgi:hypothetical protein